MSLSCKTHRPTQYQQITDGVTYTSSYQYNLSGAMTQETYPSGRVVKNTFDSNGNVARVFGKATPSSVEKTYANSFNYNASGGISAMRLGNGKWETAKFNKRLQVTELGLGHASQDASLWKVNYEFGEYDSNNGLVDTSKNTGNIAKQTVSFNGLAQPFVQTYEYDSLYRLKQAKEEVNGQTDPNWSQSFTYDRYGNRLTHVKEINGSPITHNQQTHPSIDASTNRFSDTNQFGYDKAGNLIADADGRTFTFDGNNKQILVTGNSGTVGEYFYDGDGMRVKKHVYTGGNHTKTVIFVYSGGKLAEEYSTDPVTSPKTKYTTEDHLGTPRIITGGTGEVVSRRDFMPFGQEIAKTTGTRSDSSYKYSSNEDDVKQKFTGYQQDGETMLDFAEARMYENRHARFTAVDPLLASGKSGNPQTFNRYVYVLNNPIVMVDRNGLYPVYFYTHKDGSKSFSRIKKSKDWERYKGKKITFVSTGKADGKTKNYLFTVTKSRITRRSYQAVEGDYVRKKSANAVMNQKMVDRIAARAPAKFNLHALAVLGGGAIGACIGSGVCAAAVPGLTMSAAGGTPIAATSLGIATGATLVLPETACGNGTGGGSGGGDFDECGGQQLTKQGGALTEPILPPKVILEEGGVRFEHNYRSNDHETGHVHVIDTAKNFETRIGPNGHPIDDTDFPMNRKQRKIFKKNRTKIRRAINKLGRWMWFNDQPDEVPE